MKRKFGVTLLRQWIWIGMVLPALIFSYQACKPGITFNGEESRSDQTLSRTEGGGGNGDGYAGIFNYFDIASPCSDLGPNSQISIYQGVARLVRSDCKVIAAIVLPQEDYSLDIATGVLQYQSRVYVQAPASPTPTATPRTVTGSTTVGFYNNEPESIRVLANIPSCTVTAFSLTGQTTFSFFCTTNGGVSNTACASNPASTSAIASFYYTGTQSIEIYARVDNPVDRVFEAGAVGLPHTVTWQATCAP